MYIKKVELKKFKKYKNSTIQLNDELSLLVGGNNSGKSSLLQAMATWQFCKTLLEIEKGRVSWTENATNQGVGLGIVDFTPMFIPSLSHLWTNLKSQKQTEDDGYTLKIKLFWDDSLKNEKFLEIGLSLANDRLFIKNTSSNLALQEIQNDDGSPNNENIPQIAYLPPFAGITDRESRLSPAMRNRLIGQGLSGGVIRNSIYDIHLENQNKRRRLKEERNKIANKDLNLLRETDPWEILQKTLFDLFSLKLEVTPFNEQYHSYLKIECVAGVVNGYQFKKHKNFNARDIMVEGSGFLQWLSVYTLALSEEFNVILLDEPDAHLHTQLQKNLTERLEEITIKKGKQVLLATHSTELIRAYEPQKILALSNSRGKYLGSDNEKIGLLSGIGTIFSPKIHKLTEDKRLLIVEGVSDERFLKKIFKKLELTWPKNIVTWLWTGKSSERFQLYKQLKNEIPDLKSISMRDRDDDSDHSVGADLKDKSTNHGDSDFLAMKWRRRHIENYFLDISAIARAAETSEEDIRNFFRDRHALAIPDSITSTDIAAALKDAHGKEIFISGENSLKHNFSITRDEVLEHMNKDEICDDIKYFCQCLINLSQS
ncbi:ATP-binding protein [Klebsiella pneumoniae]|uniref:AAA family ATPase n=2 Tax=Klebsiella pneumoniae TaxID=573 RepID=UPI0021A62F72|nr:ATP-binding protein [Klebsiella pneumoniae]MCT2459929.1 ATP-binding protein [Klebsiella pneumoniae]HDU3871190.1 AAA family ATPase [Klebsiella pneumoniae subsp. pneumoniae]